MSEKKVDPDVDLNREDIRLKDGTTLRRVWCIAYDGHPSMDQPHGVRTQLSHEYYRREHAEQALELAQQRSKHEPKKNLRIETRMVTEWMEDNPND